ncbi:hypothetical protein ACIBEJ_01885 [Nonomuraea sp. NPDC050790]|uniref:hypothetical protein n=1 Tax=Nonomuraea sp. NPDC050790 TaxID=3364371 RepID=UPI0037880C21
METRREELQAALARARASGDPAVPEDVLSDLARRWYAALGARMDALLEDGAPPDAVRRAYEDQSRADPTWRWVLDAHRDHPAVARTEEWFMRVTLGGQSLPI